MPGVVRCIDLCSGHGEFPPRLPISHSPDVYVDNLPVERCTDTLSIHCDSDSCHGGIYIGTRTVFANNLPIQAQTDSISCGSHCLMGSGDVQIN